MRRADVAGSLVASRPAVALDAAARLLRDAWDVRGTLVALPSERDQNLRVDVDGRPAYVLKIVNPAEDPAFLDAQDLVLERLASAGLPVQRLVATPDGRRRVGVAAAAGSPVAVASPAARLVTWLPGRPIAEVPPARRASGLARDIGVLAGRVRAALAGLDHPGAHRPFQWDPLRAEEVVARGLTDIADGRRRVLLEARLARIHAVAPRIAALPRGLVHGDLNDHNVLVDDEGRVAGLLDLGDMVWTAGAAEAAVAATYVALEAADPVAVACEVVAGAAGLAPFGAAERDALWDLVLVRASMSVAISAHQGRLDPDPYLRVSEAPMWRLLERSGGVDPDEAAARVASAAG